MKALFCDECGTALDEKGNCTNQTCKNNASPRSASTLSQEKESSPKMPTKKQWVSSEKGKMIVPDCIKPDQDEVPIKQYDIARLQTLIKGARAEGRLQVTNKRVLFRSTGTSLVGPTSLEYEFSIEEVAGIEIRKEARFNCFTTVLLSILSFFLIMIFQSVFAYVYNWKFTAAIFPVLMAIAAVVLFFALKTQRFIRFVAMSILFSALPLDDMFIETIFGGLNKIHAVAAVVVIIALVVSFLYIALAPNLVVNIKTKGGTPSVEIRRKDGLFSFHHNEYTGFSQVMPGPDADLAMHELGALIREVQQTGGYAPEEGN